MKSYRELRSRQEDFVVYYRLYRPSEGGREVTYQHLRCDFMYKGDVAENGIYMIHPEFIDENGKAIPYGSPIPESGRALMWVIVEEMKEQVHRKRMVVGTQGYFMEGSRKIGEVTIESIVELYEDRTSSLFETMGGG